MARKTNIPPAGRDGARPLQGERSRAAGCASGVASASQISKRNWGVSHGHPALRVQHRWCAATGRCGHRPLRGEGEVTATTQTSGAQRSVCAAAARSERESEQRPSKRDSPPQPPKQRLAKRKARKEQLVKFSLCPTTELCSTAYNVRRSDESSARAHADVTSTEQDRLRPRPAARQGAPRP